MGVKTNILREEYEKRSELEQQFLHVRLLLDLANRSSPFSENSRVEVLHMLENHQIPASSSSSLTINSVKSLWEFERLRMMSDVGFLRMRLHALESAAS